MSRMIRVRPQDDSIISSTANLRVQGWTSVGEGYGCKTAEDYASKHGREGDWILEIKGKVVIAERETDRDFVVGDYYNRANVIAVSGNIVLWQTIDNNHIVTDQQGVVSTTGYNSFKPTRPVVKTGQAYKKLDTSGEH